MTATMDMWSHIFITIRISSILDFGTGKEKAGEVFYKTIVGNLMSK
jgi:hypothetical protein